MDRLLLVYTAPANATIPADWCDHEHVPAHLGGAVPAVLSCTRWAAADNKTPAHLSLYDLRLTPTTSASAPPSPARSDGEGSAPTTPRIGAVSMHVAEPTDATVRPGLVPAAAAA